MIDVECWWPTTHDRILLRGKGHAQVWGEVADAAIGELWRDRLVVAHIEKSICANVDHVGTLLHALLEFDAALGRHDVTITTYF